MVKGLKLNRKKSLFMAGIGKEMEYACFECYLQAGC